MPKTKTLNIVVQYVGTDLVVNDLGDKYELYDTKAKATIKKSEDPLDFDDYVMKIWKQKGVINSQ